MRAASTCCAPSNVTSTWNGDAAIAATPSVLNPAALSARVVRSDAVTKTTFDFGCSERSASMSGGIDGPVPTPTYRAVSGKCVVTAATAAAANRVVDAAGAVDGGL